MDLHALLADTLSSWGRERPDLEFTVMGTFLRLGQLQRFALPALEHALETHGVNLGEFDVLAALRRAGAGAALTPTMLAQVAMVSPGGMTNRLDRLERAGLISRSSDPSDRRGSLVALTAAGRRVADAAIETVVASQQALLGVLSDAERGRLDRILDKLLAAVDPGAITRP
jgi:DNA-binding MarR family transcriptional regulator